MYGASDLRWVFFVFFFLTDKNHGTHPDAVNSGKVHQEQNSVSPALFSFFLGSPSQFL